MDVGAAKRWKLTKLSVEKTEKNVSHEFRQNEGRKEAEIGLLTLSIPLGRVRK